MYPVSMLSYIPEPPLPHPRVSRIKNAAEDSLESSESQEESDLGPKHRKPRVMKLVATFLLLRDSFLTLSLPRGLPLRSKIIWCKIY